MNLKNQLLFLINRTGGSSNLKIFSVILSKFYGIFSHLFVSLLPHTPKIVINFERFLIGDDLQHKKDNVWNICLNQDLDSSNMNLESLHCRPGYRDLDIDGNVVSFFF